MRVAAFSDSHGDVTGLKWGIEEVVKTGVPDAFLFCGDGARDFLSLENFMRTLNPAAQICAVRGNNDMGCFDVPDERVLAFDGVKIYMCHGHLLQVKNAMGYLHLKARENGCGIALFGHTHRGQIDEKGGVWLLNPGACGWSGYSALTLDIKKDGSFLPELVML